MRESLIAFRVGLYFVLGIALLYITYATLSERKLRPEDGYTLQAEFRDIRTITHGADVRMAGVKIGAVHETRLEEGRAIALLIINRDFQIPRDSTAQVAMSGLLGGHYITVQYGSPGAGMLGEGDTLATTHVPDMNDILAQVGDIGAQVGDFAERMGDFGGKDLAELMTNLNLLVTENRERVDAIFANLDKITSRIESGEGTLGKLLSSDEAYDQIIATMEEIRGAVSQADQTLTDAREIVAHVKSGQGALGELIYGESPLRDFDAIIANFQEFSEKLNSDQGTLGKLVNDDELYRELRALLTQAERALGTIGDSGPITAVGVAAQALF